MHWVMKSSAGRGREGGSINQSSYLNSSEVETGLPSRNGAGREVGCCDLSKLCQPRCCSQQRQTEGEGGIAKLRVRGHIFKTQGWTLRK